MITVINENLYQGNYDELNISVQGGIDYDVYDSLNVTLKINKEGNHYTIRHNLDLYNANHTEKLNRKIDEELGIGITSARMALSSLTDDLEELRNNTQEREETDATTEYQLSEDEQEEAIELLSSIDLLAKTNCLITQSGVIGEEINRQLMYLIYTSRLTNNPLHSIIFGSSGSGKTHLQSKIADLIPPEHKVEITSLTANSFYYREQHELKQKLILIEDMDGAQEALLPIRELQTKKRITKSIVQKGIGGFGRTVNHIVEGPVCVSGCTTQESIYEDNSNRSFLLYVDESLEQDARINAYQRMIYAGKVDESNQRDATNLLRNAQRLLKPIKVINPFAEYLALPSSVFKPRRTNIHYLQLIEVITFYHQYQRKEQYDESTGEAYIETTLEDIRMANTLIKDVLLRKSDTLNGVTRNYLNRLKEYINSTHSRFFTNREIRKEFGIPETTLRRYHSLLVEEQFIAKSRESADDSFSYYLTGLDEFESIDNAIEQALQLCIENIANPPEVRH
ncbi:hypothetical protein [Pseudofulvibacter geojedonensis]|uniref:Uncharacterized protein n=1 Tax=Pseudofulvibacter geojedonensis TaxID=1123758 RepID=A0ABW3I073_9FLAO